MLTGDFQGAMQDVLTASNKYGMWVREEQESANRRSLVKSEAITRIMMLDDPQKAGKQYSATAAAELVMTDKAYVVQREDESDAVACRIRAETDLFLAKAYVTYLANGGAQLAEPTREKIFTEDF